MGCETPVSQPEWERIIEGNIETWRLKVTGGWLYRVDYYQERENDHENLYYVLVGTTMSFGPEA